MSDERFEERLRRTPLAEPGEDVRERLLQSGPTRRTRSGRWTWALAVAAAGLIAVNLVYGQMHEARLAEIVGPQPATQIQCAPAMWAEAMAERAALMREMMGEQTAGGDEHEARPGPDPRTSRRHTRTALV